VFRVLNKIGYHSSFSHAGRFYTLEGVPRFDENGLWFSDEIGFSARGTLRATVEHLVLQAPAGCTHGEIERLVRLRVHDTLRSLVEAGRIGRERVEALYVYVDADGAATRAQLARRRALQPPTPTSPLDAARVIDVLLVVIRNPRAGARAVGEQLRARGLAVSDVQVEEVFTRYDLAKKKASSRSRPSRR
jgi:hypothetical protein